MNKYLMSKEEGYQVTVKMEGDLQQYAENFLKIFNNVKSNRELIRVTNDYSNNVYVVCDKDSLDATKEFLSCFGEIVETEKVLLVRMEEDIDYDLDKYDDLVIVPEIE